MDTGQTVGTRFQGRQLGQMVHLFSLLPSHPHPLSLIRMPTAIVNKDNCIMAALAGQPKCPDWDEVHT